MDITYLTEQLAVGEGVWTRERMSELRDAGFTHVVSLQAEFDESALARECGVTLLWNPTEDDFSAKPTDFFQRSVAFALAALRRGEHQVYVHCAAGVHRAPLTCAAILCALGHSLEAALDLIRARRPVVDFPSVYVESLRRFLGDGARTAAEPAAG